MSKILVKKALSFNKKSYENKTHLFNAGYNLYCFM